MVNSEVDQAVRMLRIVVTAMVLGVIGFGAVVVWLVAGGTVRANPEIADVLLLVLVGLAVAEVPAYLAVRTAMIGNLRRSRGDQAPEEVPIEALAKVYSTVTLIGSALAEALSLFGLVILLVSGTWWALAAPLAGVALIAMQLPSQYKFGCFVSNTTGRHWP